MTLVSDDTTFNDGPFLRAATRLMLIGLAVMVLALMSLYFAPMELAPFVSLGLYAMLFLLERRHGVLSPVTALMTGFYAILSGARLYAPDIAWSAYAAPAVYYLLAALVWGLLLAKRPFTMVYSRGVGYAPLHRYMSIMWGSLHVLAGCAALFLMPNLAFLIVPMVLMIAGAVGTLVLNFVTMGPAHGRQKTHQMGKFTFRQVQTPADHDLFYATIAEAYRADLQRAAGPRRKIDKAQIEAEHRASDAKRDGQSMPFLVFDGDKAVGGICMFLDHKTLGLPVEHEAQFSADDYRKRGGVVEMGRLGVMQRYRLERGLLTGLFKCVIEAAAEQRVHTILNDSFTWQIKLYSKIGFAPITDAPYACEDSSTGYGLSAQPLALDLARMVRLDQQNTTGSEVRDMLNDYVIERFFKLLAVQEIFHLRPVEPQPKPYAHEVVHAAE